MCKETLVVLSSSVLLAFAAACGPMTHPMVIRLDEQEQKTVDDAWTNMLDPPHRLARDLLLDVLITHQMHQRGVDRLVLISEKGVGRRRVVMEIAFDRQNPEADAFTFMLEDAWGNVIRQERYDRDEIDDRLAFLFQVDFRTAPPPDAPPDAPDDSTAEPPAEPAEEPTIEHPDDQPEFDELSERDKARLRRFQQITAATQPAASVESP